MPRTVVGEMTADELHRMREVTILLRAMEMAPEKFTREEIVAAIREELDVQRDIRRRLELRPGEVADFDISLGAVMESEGE